MRRYIKAVILLTVCTLLAGCQPTPEKPPVIEKNDLEQKIMQTAAPEPSEAAEQRWQEKLSEGGVEINIDATVEVPDVASWPVFQAAPYGFTVEDARKAAEVFMKGQPLYEYSNVRTKEEVQQDIILLEAEIKQIRSDASLTEKDREMKIFNTAQDLNEYKEEYEGAPEQAPERKQVAIETMEFIIDQDGNRSIAVEADLGNPRPALFTVDVSEDNMFSIISFRNCVNRDANYYPNFEATETLAGLNVSRQDALSIAQDTLKKLGLDAQLSYVRAGIDVEGLSVSEYPGTVSDPARKKCYIFYFSKVIKGLPVTNVEYCNGFQKGDEDEETYDSVWLSEAIEIAVDDSDVLGFRWERPGEAGETINGNVQLKDFEEIKSIFRKQMFFERSWTFSGISDSAITIKRAMLGLMRVRMKENKYVYLPVWDFIGDWTSTSTLYDVSVLTINAVDGSIINRELGY